MTNAKVFGLINVKQFCKQCNCKKTMECYAQHTVGKKSNFASIVLTLLWKNYICNQSKSVIYLCVNFLKSGKKTEKKMNSCECNELCRVCAASAAHDDFSASAHECTCGKYCSYCVTTHSGNSNDEKDDSNYEERKVKKITKDIQLLQQELSLCKDQMLEDLQKQIVLRNSILKELLFWLDSNGVVAEEVLSPCLATEIAYFREMFDKFSDARFDAQFKYTVGDEIPEPVVKTRAQHKSRPRQYLHFFHGGEIVSMLEKDVEK